MGFGRVGSDIRLLGALGALFYWTHRALQRVSGGRIQLLGCWFYVQPVGRQQRVNVGADDRWQLSRIEEGDVPEEAFNRPKGAVPDRFRDGSICIAARREGELAGFMWLHFGPLRERLVRCIFEPLPRGRVCWDYDFFIAPKYRMGRLFARLWDAADALMSSRGVTATVSWVEFSNRSSARAHERLGAMRMGWVVFLSIGIVQLTVSCMRPFIHLSLSNDSVCRLQVVVPAGKVLEPTIAKSR